MSHFLRAAAFTLALCCAAATARQQRQSPPAAPQPPAEAAQADEPEDPCPGARAQQELNLCASQAFEKADAELNKLYRQLTKDAGAGGRGKLRAAQLAWLKFRDAHCEYAASGNEGGSIYPMVYGFCRASLTRERSKQFGEILKVDEER